MTTEDYLAYVREYHYRLLDACILARAGLADPTPEEREELDALYEEEDPFEEQALVFQLDGSDRPLVLSFDEEDEETLEAPEEAEAEVILLTAVLPNQSHARATVGMKGAAHGAS